MGILNKIGELSDDWSDAELVHATMLEAGDKIVSLMEELKEAQSYKDDAECYRCLAEHVDFGDWFCGYSIIKDSYGATEDFYMEDKKDMDKTIYKYMKVKK